MTSVRPEIQFGLFLIPVPALTGLIEKYLKNTK